MALRLAGEEFSVVCGLDDGGWLRQIVANDAAPGLLVKQSGAGDILKAQTGDGTVTLRLTPGESGTPAFSLYSYYGGLSFQSRAGSNPAGKLYASPAGLVILESESNVPIMVDAGSGYIDVRSALKNAGPSNQGRVMIDDALDLNWNELFQVRGTPVQAVKQVTYGDASPVTIATLPAYTEVIDLKVQIIVEFNGSASLDIGDTSDSDGFMPSQAINVATLGWYGDNADDKGVYLWDNVDKHSIKKTYSSPTAVTCTIGGSGMSQGLANIYLTYRRLA